MAYKDMMNFMNMSFIEKDIKIENKTLEKVFERSITHKHDNNTVEQGNYKVDMTYNGYDINMDFYYKNKHICSWQHRTSSSRITYFNQEKGTLEFVAKVVHLITKKDYKLNEVSFNTDDDGVLTFNWLDFVYVKEKSFNLFEIETIKSLIDKIEVVENNLNYTSDFVSMKLGNLSIELTVDYEPTEDAINDIQFYFNVDDEECTSYDFNYILFLVDKYSENYSDTSLSLMMKYFITDLLAGQGLNEKGVNLLKHAFVMFYLLNMEEIFNVDDYQDIYDSLDETSKIYFLDFYVDNTHIVKSIKKEIQKIMQ